MHFKNDPAAIQQAQIPPLTIFIFLLFPQYLFEMHHVGTNLAVQSSKRKEFAWAETFSHPNIYFPPENEKVGCLWSKTVWGVFYTRGRGFWILASSACEPRKDVSKRQSVSLSPDSAIPSEHKCAHGAPLCQRQLPVMLVEKPVPYSY